ncbi:MAG: rhodanese-like domain-containing protein [Gammaproteobacteria bacterium]|nr:rhodanese-like domain-containing protein [Gammaproteobacteria bacterium]
MQQVLEFAGNHPVLIGAALALLVVIIVTELKRSGGDQLSVAETVKMMNAGGQLLDLRGNEAFHAGHILGARNIPADELAAKAGSLNKAEPLILCCDTGASSQRAAAVLKKQGFEKLFNLRGGIRAWQQENLPLKKKK